MTKVQPGDAVHVRYTVLFEDGDHVRCLDHDMPDEFTVGEGALIDELERPLLGMQAGDIKLVRIPCERALGETTSELAVELGKEELADLGIEPFDGMELLVRRPDGETVELPVTEVSDSSVRFDSSPLFQGRDIIVVLELLESTSTGKHDDPSR